MEAEANELAVGFQRRSWRYGDVIIVSQGFTCGCWLKIPHTAPAVIVMDGVNGLEIEELVLAGKNSIGNVFAFRILCPLAQVLAQA